MANEKKTIRVSAGTRVYYFDLYEDSKSQSYISISEIPTDHSPRKKRQRIFVHGNAIPRFVAAMNEIVKKSDNGKEI